MFIRLEVKHTGSTERYTHTVQFQNFILTCFVFSVATTPNCTVDKQSARSNEIVTYTCSAETVCGNISLAIEKDGTIAATGGDSVQKTFTAEDIRDSTITCMSTVLCPSVNITGKCSWHVLSSSV